MKVTVDLVRYDMDKTKKRKRANFFVDSKSEQAVMAKLERIHKGEKVQIIHELIWGKVERTKDDDTEIFEGIIKFFDSEKGFGFIKPDLNMDDLFFHVSSLGGVDVLDKQPVEFEIVDGPKGPSAIKIQPLD